MSIQNMRDSSDGVVTKVIVGLIIVVFALFGMGSITTFLAPVPKVATVNGSDITQQEMQVEIERRRRILLAQNQNVDEDLLRQDILRNLINRRLLSQAAEEFGMRFSDADLDAEIIETPVFQIDGTYNPDQFQLVIGSAGYTAVSYREEMRRDKMFTQLDTGIRGTSFYTNEEVLRTSALAQQTRDIAFLRVDAVALSKTVEVTEDEVEDYFNSHKNDFMTEEAIDIAYVEVLRDDLLAGIDVPEEELVIFFEDTKEIYAEPERRRIAHILVEVSDQVSDEEAKAEIDEVYEALMSAGDFAALALEHSDDPGSAELGGDLGFNDAGTFVDEFEAAASELSLNQLSAPVKTEFGYHILRLLDLEAAKEPTLAEVRERVLIEFKTAAAEEIFVGISAQLSEIAYESPDLMGPADELSLEIKTTGLLIRSKALGIAANAAVLQAVYSSDVLVDGNNSSLLEITPNHHVVVRMNSYQREEVKPLADVAEVINEIISFDKASEIARNQAQEMVTMLESGSLTRYVADEFGIEWTVVGAAKRNQLRMDREINVEAFSLPRPAPGNKSIGYAILSNSDAVVISVTNVKNKNRDEVAGDGGDTLSLAKVLASQQGLSDYREFRDNLSASGSVETIR